MSSPQTTHNNDIIILCMALISMLQDVAYLEFRKFASQNYKMTRMQLQGIVV